jgi:proteasome lid subunit RPN8/RPN11
MMMLSEILWDTLLDEFRWPPRTVERVAYIDGFQFGEIEIATTLTFPEAVLCPGYFTVSGAAMSKAGKHFRGFGMQRLAQVHTHPGRDVRHSEFDNENAYSQLDGAISIVLPYHARRRTPVLDCGVHIRLDSGWVRLRPKQIPEQIQIVPGCLDFRRYQCAT